MIVNTCPHQLSIDTRSCASQKKTATSVRVWALFASVGTMGVFGVHAQTRTWLYTNTPF